MAKMRVQGSRVIISGHETTKEECNAVTLMCDEIAKSKDFRLVEYRPGYAEFEAVGQAEDLKFVPEGTNQLVWNGIIFCQNDYSRFMTYVSDTQFKLTSYGNLPESMVEQGWIDADNSNDFTYTAPRKILSVGGETWGEDGYVLASAPPGESVSYEVILEATPSVPTPDWANCFEKTSAGNKAVEKVWIKQNGQLVTVWYGGGGGGAAVNFATDSWETISAACKDGSYKTVYKVGDTKDIELSTGETITVAIMGFDHDDLSDGSGKAPITVAMENLLATKYPMNSSYLNSGGWDDSAMRTSTMVTLLSQLPSDLQSVIKQVNKKATAGSQSKTIITSVDKLWLFAEVEVDGTTKAGYADEGKQYEYWKTVKDGTVDDDRKKYLSNGSGSANPWWLRSPSVSNNMSFRVFDELGVVQGYIANNSNGVCFGFCVG